jgi:hypothetical protein
MEWGAVIFGGWFQQGNFKIPRLLPHTFLVEKWIPPTRSETAEFGQKTEGFLGVKNFVKNLWKKIQLKKVKE